MALDIEKLRKTAQELQTRMARGGGGPALRFFKPRDGRNVVRVLPAWTTEGPLAGQFWREVHQHWNVSEDSGPLLCPQKTPYASDDKECPICELVDQLRDRKSDLEAQELVKKLRAKLAYLMSVVDLDDPVYTAKDVGEWTKARPEAPCPFEAGDTKVQCYAAGSMVAEQIMNIVLANNMDITDRDVGHNVVLTKIPNRDPMKTRYTVTPELTKTKAPIPAEYVLPDLGKVGQVKAYNDLAKALADGPAGDFTALLPASTESGIGHDDVSWVSENAKGNMLRAGQDDDLAAQMRAELDK